MKKIDYRFSVAPMMDWTDRHCRAFHRELSDHTLLYTEMVTADAVIHGDRERLIGYSDVEHPVALQLGGNEPDKLAEAARIVEDFGYDEVNLNCGCPSDRVQSGAFGACLMREPDLVADCLSAMQKAVSIPVTVKHRIGVDEDDERECVYRFVETVKNKSDCTVFIAHARKAWLKGLSPKENRDIPPLNYPLIHDLKSDFSDLTIVLNGGLTTLDDSLPHLEKLDGIMLGRAPYQNPSLMLGVDTKVFGAPQKHADMISALLAYREYIVRALESGTPLHGITRHLLGSFNGLPGARLWRRHLSENAPRAGADISVFDTALDFVQRYQDEAEPITNAQPA